MKAQRGVVGDVFAGIRMLSGEPLAEPTNTGRCLDATPDSANRVATSLRHSHPSHEGGCKRWLHRLVGVARWTIRLLLMTRLPLAAALLTCLTSVSLAQDY